jgi:hypothetical protein
MRRCHPREGGDRYPKTNCPRKRSCVIPAKAGIANRLAVIPAKAGIANRLSVIPAKAGIANLTRKFSTFVQTQHPHVKTSLFP